jgi:nicotinic acid mononucleotide adenylyltransferase
MAESADDIIKINDNNTDHVAHFIFGRFQPPTIGHGALIQAISNSAGKGDAYVFVSSTQDAKKNPLSVEQKIKWLKQMFGEQYSNVKFVNTTTCPTVSEVTTTTRGCKNPIVAIYALIQAGYKNAFFYAGSDRAEGYEKTVKKCNFEGIQLEVKTVGKDREPEPQIVGKKRGFVEQCPSNMNIETDTELEENDISGVSGTKMRKYAVDCDTVNFTKGVINLSDNDVNELIGEIRTGLNLPGCPVTNGGKRRKTVKKRNNKKRRNTRRR